MNKTVNSPTPIEKKEGWSVFLAGPMKASPRGWRIKLVKAASDMEAMNQTLMERWNRMVEPDDKVIVKGDIGTSEWLHLINGTFVKE